MAGSGDARDGRMPRRPRMAGSGDARDGRMPRTTPWKEEVGWSRMLDPRSRMAGSGVSAETV